jgi:endogenous inhibitor of DNA gyrase (YacG/DUF329 family)
MKKLKCPKCKEEFDPHFSKWKPFCSKKCQEIDLGHWLSGSYVIPSKEEPKDEEGTNNDE